MILAVDPGRGKSGLAVMDREGVVHFQGIVERDQFKETVEKLMDSFPVEVIVLGDGTFSSESLEILEGPGRPPVKLIDEAYTTFEAEKRYREERLNGLMRIFRFINWKPDRPLDDYVAVILARRYLESQD